jgi:nucleoside diphosphate kinase
MEGKVKSIIDSKTIAIVVEHLYDPAKTIERLRKLAGTTSPPTAELGTIRNVS